MLRIPRIGKKRDSEKKDKERKIEKEKKKEKAKAIEDKNIAISNIQLIPQSLSTATVEILEHEKDGQTTKKTCSGVVIINDYLIIDEKKCKKEPINQIISSNLPDSPKNDKSEEVETIIMENNMDNEDSEEDKEEK